MQPMTECSLIGGALSRHSKRGRKKKQTFQELIEEERKEDPGIRSSARRRGVSEEMHESPWQRRRTIPEEELGTVMRGQLDTPVLRSNPRPVLVRQKRRTRNHDREFAKQLRDNPRNRQKIVDNQAPDPEVAQQVAQQVEPVT